MGCLVEDVVSAALQRGLPLVSRPFHSLAIELGISEGELVSEAERLREAGAVRRFGAVFDTRRLGYRSALCSATVPAAEVDAAAARVTPLSGVTHCYLREAESLHAAPNLWFTLSYPSDIFAAMEDEARARLSPHPVEVLPALRRYKIDVMFGADVQAREERVDSHGDAPPSPEERAMVRALQGDTEIRPDYFAAVAEKVDAALESAGRKPIREWGLLSRLEMWRRSGRLKRIGLLLAHRAAGWTANCMCCWNVPGGTTDAGRALAACGEVTHCYERPLSPGFPYNLYAMIHARSREEACASFGRIESACGLEGGVRLFSTREYKKTSMTFFDA